jgi:hypothetical protein
MPNELPVNITVGILNHTARACCFTYISNRVPSPSGPLWVTPGKKQGGVRCFSRALCLIQQEIGCVSLSMYLVKRTAVQSTRYDNDIEVVIVI